MTIDERVNYISKIAERYRKTAEHYDSLAAAVRDGGPLATSTDFLNDLAGEVASRAIADMLPLPTDR